MGNICALLRDSLAPRTTIIFLDTIEDVISQQNAAYYNYNYLQIILITKMDNLTEECPICREIMSEDAVKTECGHTYHKDCIVTWLRIGEGRRRFKCPMCVSDLSLSP